MDCIACTLPCNSCSGAGDKACKSCISPFILRGAQCFCPDGKFQVGVACQSCHSSCKTCGGLTANDCLTCPNTFILTASKTCVCPDGTYLNGNKCEACSSKCATCNGASDKSCMSCKAGTFKFGTECQKCNDLCNECNGATNKDCLSCKMPMLLVGKECQCPVGTYLDGLTCKNCHVDCESCTGPLSTQCIKCAKGGSDLLKNFISLVMGSKNLGYTTITRIEDSSPLGAKGYIDIVFALDTTGSMGTYLAQMQTTVTQIVTSIQSTTSSKGIDVRFGIVAYRDHPNQEP